MILGLLSFVIFLSVLINIASFKLSYHYVRTLNVPLGHRVWMGKKQDSMEYLTIGRFGVYLIIGRSRSGKSCILKSIISVVSNWSDRRVIIFDPYGEYKRCVNPNFSSRPYSMGFKNFRVLENLVFKISDFKAIDWVSLGFSETGAQVLEQLAEDVELHHNNFETFQEIVQDIPTKKGKYDEINFRSKWGKSFILHSQTDAQLKLKVGWFKDYFMEDDGQGHDMRGRTYVPNIAEELSKSNLIINLNMKKGSDKSRAVSYTGIMLRQLKPFIQFLKPIVVMEEADLICSNPDPNANIAGGFLPSAAIELSDYSIKMQRDDVCVFYITQDHSLLYPVLAHNWHYKILGILDQKSRDAEYTHGLQNDFVPRAGAWREFVLLSASNKVSRFVPLDCPCQI